MTLLQYPSSADSLTTLVDRTSTGEPSVLWYKDAIIYQLHVRAFRDSNGDGIGDFAGLTSALDYIQDLGVTAVWLLPFFPSPLKDDGYDIADYMDVNPQYGSLNDVHRFLEEAHRRDLRVITELVMNHTSDQHAWFQRARKAPQGSQWRDWYVWSDTPKKYEEARIIFQDFESSNWSWDPVAGAYFWHRFYSHQPDLNFDNPEVRQAMLDAVDFWFDMGVDGLRLDAVPYLFEREGTNCENLPETHAFLRDVRAHIDGKFDDKMLLAEANQWPEDAAEYFGAGDECHMNFHFPLMPRLFMAVEREDRSPIVDIIDQTPLVPSNCQWAIFLRNHDELTLEMVTDEERDYMYRTYAVDAKARVNLGIRRRLAPLLSNNRRKIELMNSLLLSLPGTPIIYYGDEIGMGDNYYLGDRNGVRTPMHWSGDRNAGFSRANPQSLYLPVIIDPEYHYEFCNVEVQHANPHSLLWWTRRTLDVRKQHSAFGNGSFKVVPASNAKVFAFVRAADDEVLLIVANLSRYSQYVELDLSEYSGTTPHELFGKNDFAPVADHPYVLSLSAHGFLWFTLRASEPLEDTLGAISTSRWNGNWNTLLKNKPLSRVLERYMRHHRWFSEKARRLQSLDIMEAFQLDPADNESSPCLLLLSASYADGEPDSFVLPVALLGADRIQEESIGPIVRVEGIDGRGARVLVEITGNEELWKQLIRMIRDRQQISGVDGSITGVQTTAFPHEEVEPMLDGPITVHKGEHSNSSARIADRLILKLFRRVTFGSNPDFEIGRQLTEHESIAHVPRVGGAIEYRTTAGKLMTLAILHEYVPNVGDAWTYTLDELDRYFERMQVRSTAPNEDYVLPTLPIHAASEPLCDEHGRSLESYSFGEDGSSISGSADDSMLPELVRETIGSYLRSAELLARRTAELHVTLARTDGGSAFTPQPFTRLYQRGLYQSMRSQARATLALLQSQLPVLPETTSERARELLNCEAAVLDRFNDLLRVRIEAHRIRCHGDYHLGQVLFTGKDFAIIDFEGAPDRAVSERRIKTSPLRDVAGLLRSFHYAAHTALRAQAPLLASQPASEGPKWAEFWYAWTSHTFLQTYLCEAEAGGFLPTDRHQMHTLLTAYLVEKALYELRSELNERPDWVAVPLEGILQLIATQERLEF
ncbi:MAG: maltose alpha-D-glucosyltransferase [Pirellulales bacterium]